MIRATSNEETLRRLRSICLSLPESSETGSWGHPNFKAGKKVFVAFERVKGRASIAFRLDPDEVNRLLGRQEFFVTPYGRGQWVSLWADGRIAWRTVEDLAERSYRVVALKRMLTALEAEGPEPPEPIEVKSKGKGRGQRSGTR